MVGTVTASRVTRPRQVAGMKGVAGGFCGGFEVSDADFHKIAEAMGVASKAFA